MRLDRITIRIPDNKLAYRPIERLRELAEKRERGVNYLVVEAKFTSHSYLGRTFQGV